LKRSIIIPIMIGVVFVFSLFLSAGKEDKEVLFPKREYLKKMSQVFFKKVDLSLPLVEKVDFFARSEAYPSAYLALSPYLVKHAYVSALFSSFEVENYALLDVFKSYREEITMDNYPVYFSKLTVGKYKFYLLILYTLTRDFQENRLSGEIAFQFWNVLLRLTESALKEKENHADNAALLAVSARLIFFKDCKKWQKKAQKLLHSHKQKTGVIN